MLLPPFAAAATAIAAAAAAARDDDAVTLKFSEDYPQAPPVGTMPGIYHVNIFPDGGYICLSVLKVRYD